MACTKKIMLKRPEYFSMAPAFLKNTRICDNTLAYFYFNIKSFYLIDAWYGTKRKRKSDHGISPWLFPSSKTLGNSKKHSSLFFLP
jgi:hypothetical protein